MAKTGFSNGFADVPTRKYYKYHGWVRDCNTEPVLPPYGEYDTPEGPYPIFTKELKITTLYQCGETHWPPNLFAPLGYLTCNPDFVRGDDVQYLYTKNRSGAGNAQVLYNKESLLAKIIHKVVAIQSVTVYMKGEVFIYVPASGLICGPNTGQFFVACSQTEYWWQPECQDPGSINTVKYEWTKCKPPLAAVRNWGMKDFEEDCKIGFRLQQSLEDDPADYGVNRSRCYYNYCIVKYKNTSVVTRGFDSLVWDIGPTWAFLYGEIEGGGNGYFIRGFEYWKKATPNVKMEGTSTGAVGSDYLKYWKKIEGLDPDTIYNYRALLRNTGMAGDTIYGIVKGFTTKP